MPCTCVRGSCGRNGCCACPAGYAGCDCSERVHNARSIHKRDGISSPFNNFFEFIYQLLFSPFFFVAPVIDSITQAGTQGGPVTVQGMQMTPPPSLYSIPYRLTLLCRIQFWLGSISHQRYHWRTAMQKCQINKFYNFLLHGSCWSGCLSTSNCCSRPTRPSLFYFQLFWYVNRTRGRGGR